MEENTENTDLSFGQMAVGVSFNPSGSNNVANVKELHASIIDIMNDLRLRTVDGEIKRMCSVAITEAQTSCMWGVKALTWNKNV